MLSCVQKDLEQILLPLHGGGFGDCAVSQDEKPGTERTWTRRGALPSDQLADCPPSSEPTTLPA